MHQQMARKWARKFAPLSLVCGLVASGLMSGCHAGSSAPGTPGTGGAAGTPFGSGGSGVSTTPAPPVGSDDLAASCAGVSLTTAATSGVAPLRPGQVVIGPTLTQEVAPPAISGGTLLALPDGKTAVASDPDRDQIYIVNLTDRQVAFTVPLERGDEPGRLVADGRGQVHVVLRRGGAVVTLDPTTGVTTGRRPVCAAPRGLAHDPATDLIHVACAGGELISLPAAGGAATRMLRLERDLRDVVVQGKVLRVSRFRSAEVLIVAGDGTVSGRIGAGDFRSPLTRGGQLFTSSVAWRMVGTPDGGVAMVHQRGVDDQVQHGASSSYGGQRPCQSIVHTAVTRMKGDGSLSRGLALASFPLAVDMAISADGKNIALISAGNSRAAAVKNTGSVVYASDLESVAREDRGCEERPAQTPCSKGLTPTGSLAECRAMVPTVAGEATAVAFTAEGTIMVQTREPATLTLAGGSVIQLSVESRNDTGHALFHANAGAGLACASCHPEGQEDGRTWNFACMGRRRTQSLQTGLRGTEPFHWDGDERDFGALIRDVLTNRMGGPDLQPEQVDTMLSWIDRQPRTRPLPLGGEQDAIAHAAATRGQALFNDTTRAGCVTCHVGPQLTNSKTVDVGTGRAFQVPSLVGIANHAPFMHNGCAKTLRDRFSAACGGGDRHGKTSDLSAAELSDLLVYLETL